MIELLKLLTLIETCAEDGAAEGQPEGGWCGHRHDSTEDPAPDKGRERER